MIDLCKIFGVEEGEEFKFDCRNLTEIVYKVEGNTLMLRGKEPNDFLYSNLCVNNLSEIKNIIKLPKKKQFTDDELCILRNIDKEFKWIARDEYRDVLYMYKEKPEKTKDGNWYGDNWCRIGIYNHLFNSIQWEDEEPVFIDDYVER